MKFYILSLLLFPDLAASVFFPFNDRDVGTCGDCFCIPSEGEECPVEVPLQDISFSRLFNLQTIQPLNPIDLTCDPYTDPSCDATPPLAAEGGVCGVQIIPDSDRVTFLDFLFGRDLSCPTQYTYQIDTFASAAEAESNGYIVTHDGNCGVCSTFQDLAVYLKYPDLTTIGISCGFAAILGDFEAAVKCYEAFGFSRSCASISIYNTFNTNEKCDTCIKKAILRLPNNGPAPDCELDECLQCDEDESGPLFKKFAGRTRRSNGILSGIARRCDELVDDIPQIDPCNV